MVRGCRCGCGSVVVPHVLVRKMGVATARRRVAQRVAIAALATYAAVAPARARAPALPAEHCAALVCCFSRMSLWARQEQLKQQDVCSLVQKFLDGSDEDVSK